LKKQAFVVGNGTSRSSINLQLLKDKGKVYGCNALYREFVPDYLIAVDVKMILEINKAGYQNNNIVWTNPNKAYREFKNFNYFNPSKGWSSGPTALYLASEHDNDEIYILGFDYQGLGDKVNNIYADTKNYKKSSDKATYFGNWLKQTMITCQKFPKKRYIRVLDENGYIPKEFKNIPNLTHININEFQEIQQISEIF
jgi:hypothetical protein